MSRSANSRTAAISTMAAVALVAAALGRLHPGLGESVRLAPSGELPRLRLRCGRSVTPTQQLVDPSDLVVGDAAEHIGEPCLPIDAVQLGALDQGVGDG